MKRAILAALAAVTVLVTPAFGWEKPVKEVVPEVDKSVKEIRLEGTTDIEMLKQVRSDIDSARRDKILRRLRLHC